MPEDDSGSGDGDHIPPKLDDSDEGWSTDSCDEDSDRDEPAGSKGDADELGSDAGYESYGLADL